MGEVKGEQNLLLYEIHAVIMYHMPKGLLVLVEDEISMVTELLCSFKNE